MLLVALDKSNQHVSYMVAENIDKNQERVTEAIGMAWYTMGAA